VRQIVIKVLNIIDARCNHEVWQNLYIKEHITVVGLSGITLQI